MKAVVLARGAGRRMQQPGSEASLTRAQAAAAAAGQKVMMPIEPVGASGEAAGRPFLDYVLASLADAGCTDVALVIGPEHDAVRRRYLQDLPPRRIRVAFATQVEPAGTADAVLAAESWVGADAFLVVNADNLYPGEALRALVELDRPGLPAFERDELVRSSRIPAERVGAFALVEVDEAGDLARIVEKPGAEAVARAGPHALVSMNCWRLDERILPACRDVPRSSRGEFELPQAVDLARSRGVRVAVVRARGPVLDLSQRSDVAFVSACLAGWEPVL